MSVELPQWYFNPRAEYPLETDNATAYLCSASLYYEMLFNKLYWYWYLLKCFKFFEFFCYFCHFDCGFLAPFKASVADVSFCIKLLRLNYLKHLFWLLTCFKFFLVFFCFIFMLVVGLMEFLNIFLLRQFMKMIFWGDYLIFLNLVFSIFCVYYREIIKK